MPVPDFVDDIYMAERMGVPAWELEHLPFEWYQRYSIVLDAEHRVADRSRRKGGSET